MGKPKFTPGPWFVYDNKYYLEIRCSRPDGWSDEVANTCSSLHRWGVQQAAYNAHLIAAAPDMYEALQGLLRNFDGYQGMELKKAKAALKKAEGV